MKGFLSIARIWIVLAVCIAGCATNPVTGRMQIDQNKIKQVNTTLAQYKWLVPVGLKIAAAFMPGAAQEIALAEASYSGLEAAVAFAKAAYENEPTADNAAALEAAISGIQGAVKNLDYSKGATPVVEAVLAQAGK